MPEPGHYSSTALRIATRGSALALAQARLVQALCQKEFPRVKIEIKIIKTTGDKLQTASLSNPDQELPKGLFTKEIEEALLANDADLAVHSLKDLPVDLPSGLILGAVPRRADPRDVLIYRDALSVEGRAPLEWSPGQPGWRGFLKGLRLAGLPDGAVIGTGSTRREAQARIVHPGLKFSPIRGNVGTRLRKLAEDPGLDAVILAAAGLDRLGFVIFPDGRLKGEGVPEGLLASPIEPEEMAPCAGQGAIGIEIREGDEGAREICGKINHFPSFQAAAAERSFLKGMGGGCQSPVGAYGRVIGHRLHLSGVMVSVAGARRAEGTDLAREAERLGRAVAERLKAEG